MISIQEKNINYNENFHLFITSSLPNPFYSAETYVKTTVINFAITSLAFEEQMLAYIVNIENPALERRKIDLLEKNALDKELLV